MEVVKREKNGILILSIKDRLDAVSAPEAETIIYECIDLGARRIIINLEELNYISSAGLRILLLSGRKMKKNGGKIVICSMGPNVKRVFDISGFTIVFEICMNEKEAFQSFGIDRSEKSEESVKSEKPESNSTLG